MDQVQTPELVAASLRESLNAIGTITGHVTPDEIIGEVFSTFCIGK
jgi:tRNA modification GTPase